MINKIINSITLGEIIPCIAVVLFAVLLGKRNKNYWRKTIDHIEMHHKEWLTENGPLPKKYVTWSVWVRVCEIKDPVLIKYEKEFKSMAVIFAIGLLVVCTIFTVWF